MLYLSQIHVFLFYGFVIVYLIWGVTMCLQDAAKDAKAAVSDPFAIFLKAGTQMLIFCSPWFFGRHFFKIVADSLFL